MCNVTDWVIAINLIAQNNYEFWCRRWRQQQHRSFREILAGVTCDWHNVAHNGLLFYLLHNKNNIEFHKIGLRGAMYVSYEWLWAM